MPTFSPQNNGNKNPNNIREFVLLLFIMLNGVSTGGVIRTSRHMINNGADSETVISLLLYLGCTIYTAQRAYEIYKQVHKDDNNNTQR